MPNKKKMKQNKAMAAKRRRVNTLKTLIVFAAVILLFTSVTFNLVMVVKVLHLDRQIGKLYSDSAVTVQNTLYL